MDGFFVSNGAFSWFWLNHHSASYRMWLIWLFSLCLFHILNWDELVFLCLPGSYLFLVFNPCVFSKCLANGVDFVLFLFNIFCNPPLKAGWGSGLFLFFVIWLLSCFSVGCSCLLLLVFCLFGVSDYSVGDYANILHRNFLRFTPAPSVVLVRKPSPHKAVDTSHSPSSRSEWQPSVL